MSSAVSKIHRRKEQHMSFQGFSRHTSCKTTSYRTSSCLCPGSSRSQNRGLLSRQSFDHQRREALRSPIGYKGWETNRNCRDPCAITQAEKAAYFPGGLNQKARSDTQTTRKFRCPGHTSGVKVILPRKVHDVCSVYTEFPKRKSFGHEGPMSLQSLGTKLNSVHTEATVQAPSLPHGHHGRLASATLGCRSGLHLLRLSLRQKSRICLISEKARALQAVLPSSPLETLWSSSAQGSVRPFQSLLVALLVRKDLNPVLSWRSVVLLLRPAWNFGTNSPATVP